MIARPSALALILALEAPAAFACALPAVEEAKVSPCATVEVHESQLCLEDSSAPGGYRIVSDMDPSLPDCAAAAAGGCVMVRPLDAEAGVSPLRLALAVLTGL